MMTKALPVLALLAVCLLSLGHGAVLKRTKSTAAVDVDITTNGKIQKVKELAGGLKSKIGGVAGSAKKVGGDLAKKVSIPEPIKKLHTEGKQKLDSVKEKIDKKVADSNIRETLAKPAKAVQGRLGKKSQDQKLSISTSNKVSADTKTAAQKEAEKSTAASNVKQSSEKSSSGSQLKVSVSTDTKKATVDTSSSAKSSAQKSTAAAPASTSSKAAAAATDSKKTSSSGSSSTAAKKTSSSSTSTPAKTSSTSSSNKKSSSKSSSSSLVGSLVGTPTKLFG